MMGRIALIITQAAQTNTHTLLHREKERDEAVMIKCMLYSVFSKCCELCFINVIYAILSIQTEQFVHVCTVCA